MPDWDLDKTIPATSENGQMVRSTPFVDEFDLNETKPVSIVDTIKEKGEEVGREVLKEVGREMKIIRWPFWRFIEQPVSTMVEATQQPEGKTIGGTLAKAFQGYVPFRKIPVEEYGNYGQIWRNYYKASRKFFGGKGFIPMDNPEEPPDWYLAMASYGTAMGVEPPIIRGFEKGAELAATRVATAQEASVIRNSTPFKVIDKSLKGVGIDPKNLHSEGSIIQLSDESELFLNKYVTAVLRGGEIRVPRWAKISQETLPVVPKEALSSLTISDSAKILPLTGKEVVLPPPTALAQSQPQAGEVVGQLPNQGLVVANKGADGKIYVGEKGDLHFNLSEKYSSDIRKKMGLKVGDATWESIGFIDNQGNYLTREEALKKVNIKSSIGKELDAKDLQEQTLQITSSGIFDKPQGGEIAPTPTEWKVTPETTMTPRSPEINKIRLEKTKNTKSYADIFSVNPDDTITIWRAVPKGGKIESGDWVAVDKNIARTYGSDIIRRGEANEVNFVSKKVKASEIKLHPDHQTQGVNDEFIYNPTEGKVDKLNKLKAEAHTIADKKGFISEKGKPKPQYRKLAEAVTGKKSMKDMDEYEASIFVDALKKLPEPVEKKGKMVPTSIPKTTNLVTEDFFTQTFKKPTPVKMVTSQTRYAELLGVKKLTEPFEIAKQKLDLEYGRVSNQVDIVVKKIKKMKNMTSEKMAQLLNTSEEAPAELSNKEKEIFNYFRDLTREIIDRENSVRNSLGLEPIKYRKAYLRHIADIMSDEVISGKFAPPEGLKYWSEKIVGKKVYNPMEMKRKLKDELLDYFSKDLGYVMKSMMWTGLKEVYFAQPKYFFNRLLGALSKDKKIYPLLSEQEKAIYDAQMTMPASTKRWLIDYVNIVLSGRQTALDESVNLWVTDSPIKDVINAILKPFGKHLSHRPVTNLITKFSKLPIYGVMGGVNPRQLLRNKMQTLQEMALYGVKNTLLGYTSTKDYPVLNELKTDSLFKESYSGFEDMPAELRGKVEKIGLAPYHWTAISNVSQGMNAAYHWTARYIQDPAFKDFGWADPQRTYKEGKDFFYPSEKQRLLKEMEYGAHTAHFQYIGMGMPEVFRYKSLSGITRLQSWWMNHWFVFHREAATRAFTGHAGYDVNLRIRLGDRINYLKYLIIAGLILNTLGYERSYLLGTAPTSLPPTAQLCLGLYTYFTHQGDSDYEQNKRKEAEYQIKESAKTFIPGYLSLKDIAAFMSGEKDWTEYLFYKKEGKSTSGLPMR